MATKTVPFSKEGIESLPNNKPVIYRLLNSKGENVYTGIASRGNVHDRLLAHLPGHQDAVKDAERIRIEQMGSIKEAERKEAHIISRSRPKHNKKGK